MWGQCVGGWILLNAQGVFGAIIRGMANDPQDEINKRRSDAVATVPHSEPELAEITPEMIEAGVMAMLAYDSRFEDEDAAVIRIYRAMVSARVDPEPNFDDVDLI